MLRSKSLSFEFSELDFAWLCPSLPSPDPHLTWTWTWAWQFRLQLLLGSSVCQSTDVTSAPPCPWWWRSNCSELTNSQNSHSLTRCFSSTTLSTLWWAHTRPIISSEYLMSSKSESLHHHQKFTFLIFQSFHGSDPSVQLHNCYHFLTNWMSAFPNRGIYHTGMVFCRYAIIE